MVTAELSDGRVWLLAEWRDKERCKMVPGATYDRDAGQWHTPLSWAACCSIRGIFGDDLQIGEQLNAWAWDEFNTRVGPCTALREGVDANPLYTPPAGYELEPLQRVGVEFMRIARQALNGDGMGSGKTIQTIAALEALAASGEDPYPALIVCPTSLKRNWEREFNTWAPSRKVQVVQGGAATRRKQMQPGTADVYVINWEAVRLHTRVAGYGYIKLSDDEKTDKEIQALGLATVVADEAHRGKNPQAKQTRALWGAARGTTFRYALSGTPVANTPEDMWTIMHFLAPEEWPSKSRWIERYGLMSWNPFGGMSVVGIRGETKDELFKFLDPRMIRRPTQLVIGNLPEKLPPLIREVELSAKQRKAYNSVREELLAELDSGVLMATNPLTRMTRLLQLASAYGEIGDDGEMRLSEPSSKLDDLDDLLEELTGEQVVVFAESRQLLELASARFQKHDVSHGMITGAVTPDERQAYVDRFQAGELRVMLCTFGAGGEGITLTASRHPVRLQRSFSLIKNLQSVDRVWRKGQHRVVQPIDIVAADTLDSRVMEVGEEKYDMLQEIARDEETLRKWLAK